MARKYHYEWRAYDNSLGWEGGRSTPWCRRKADVYNYGLRGAFMVIVKRRFYDVSPERKESVNRYLQSL